MTRKTRIRPDETTLKVNPNDGSLDAYLDDLAERAPQEWKDAIAAIIDAGMKERTP